MTASSLAMDFAALGLAYFGIALPAAKIVVSDRDKTLANGIREACRIATTDGPGRVVAVLGFLHVNGIVRLLLERDLPSSRTATTSLPADVYNSTGLSRR